MSQLLTAIALWCGTPTLSGASGGWSHEERTYKQVDTCRQRLIECALWKNQEEFLECFKKEKLSR
jgi:hypothetical protein